MDQDQLLDRLLAQNERLIEALTRTNPVEILRALNPPAQVVRYQEPWSGDEGHQQPPEDPWGDPNVTPADVIPSFSGWTDPPFKAEQDSEITEEDDGSLAGTESD